MQKGGKKLIYTIVVVIVVLSIYSVLSPFFNWFPFNRKEIFPSPPGDGKLDYEFIKNLTLSLSNITYPKGMLYKGRAFGSWGEHNASEVLFKDMDKLGLNPTKEPIEPGPAGPIENVARKVEILEREFKINNRKVDCFILPNWSLPIGMDEIREFEFSGLKVKRKPQMKIIDTILKNVTSNFTYLPSTYEELMHLTKNYIQENIELIYRWCNKSMIEESKDFLYIAEDPFFNKKYPPLFLKLGLIKNPFNPLNLFYNQFKLEMEMFLWRVCYSRYGNHCKGLILYDFNHKTQTHDMVAFNNRMGLHYNLPLFCPVRLYPIIFINRSKGHALIENKNCSVSYHLKLRCNNSVESYNIIGQINGKHSDKTFIVCSLYDCWWNQGTGDSAIGMSMVLAVAKYFQDNNIKPKHNMKFIAFCGEEYGLRGAYYYVHNHLNENISYVIDLNQICFKQPSGNNPDLTLNIISNKIKTRNEVKEIINETDYLKSVENVSDVRYWVMPFLGAPSNTQAFVEQNRKRYETICFLKDTGWVHHHRDGLNHTEGDTMKYFYPDDVNATGTMVLNVVYGLMFKETRWIWAGFIPFIIAIAIIIIATILIWKRRGLQ